MGERLNLEIWNNGKVLANAYYHWSGFTDSAVDIVTQALNFIKNNAIENDNTLLYAIRVLEATGAGLTDREIEYAKTHENLNGKKFAPCEGRNAGLIGISPDEINSTRSWQEHAAYIFVDEQRVSFRVFWTQRAWEYEKEQKEYNGRIVNARDLTHAEWNTDDIKFAAWEDFTNFINLLNHEPFISNIEPHEVISHIY